MRAVRKSAKNFFLKNNDRSVIRLLRRLLLFIDGGLEIIRARFFFFNKRENLNAYLPDVLGIGAQKAATTWIDKVLRCHPDLALPEGRKELHFFDSNFWKGWLWYAWHFRNSGNRTRVEITPSYSILPPEKIQEIVDALPGIKVVLILRNPVERAWSMASMDLAKHRFRDISAVEGSELIDHFSSEKSVERGRYSEIISRWETSAGAENVFVGFYDEIVESPVKFIEGLFTFLHVDPADMDWSQTGLLGRENTTGHKMPDETRKLLAGIYRDEIIELDKKLNHRVTREWVRKLPVE